MRDIFSQRDRLRRAFPVWASSDRSRIGVAVIRLYQGERGGHWFRFPFPLSSPHSSQCQFHDSICSRWTSSSSLKFSSLWIRLSPNPPIGEGLFRNLFWVGYVVTKQVRQAGDRIINDAFLGLLTGNRALNSTVSRQSIKVRQRNKRRSKFLNRLLWWIVMYGTALYPVPPDVLEFGIRTIFLKLGCNFAWWRMGSRLMV